MEMLSLVWIRAHFQGSLKALISVFLLQEVAVFKIKQSEQRLVNNPDYKITIIGLIVQKLIYMNTWLSEWDLFHLTSDIHEKELIIILGAFHIICRKSGLIKDLHYGELIGH